jgi:hypothetical protein
LQAVLSYSDGKRNPDGVPRDSVLQAAVTKGIAEAAIKQAKTRLHVESLTKDALIYWVLPKRVKTGGRTSQPETQVELPMAAVADLIQ